MKVKQSRLLRHFPFSGTIEAFVPRFLFYALFKNLCKIHKVDIG